jgi:surface antigen/LysM repeat protein
LQKRQLRFARFIKRHKTIKILHLIRNYSALTVVVSCAILVAGTNVVNTSGGWLLGYWQNNKNSTFNDSQLANGQQDRKDNLVLVPLVKASASVDPNATDETLDNAVFIKNQAVAANISPMKDPEEDGGVKIYEVQSGDTVSTIASKFKITSNTILWANDIDNIDEIKPGDKLFILPVAGLTYTIANGDTIDSIANKYKAEKSKIIAFNDLPADGKVEVGAEIVIPDGEKEIPQTPSTQDTGIARRQYATTDGGTPTVSGWRELEGHAGAGHKFPYGYCTWYVAQKRYVPWGGNAGTWLYHAKVAGYRTGKSPRVGAIMVSSESWWGHVALVESVSGDSFTVSEMNYRGWAKKSTRTLSIKSGVVKGFIY